MPRELAAPSRSCVVRYDSLFHVKVPVARSYSDEQKHALWDLAYLTSVKLHLLQEQICWHQSQLATAVRPQAVRNCLPWTSLNIHKSKKFSLKVLDICDFPVRQSCKINSRCALHEGINGSGGRDPFLLALGTI